MRAQIHGHNISQEVFFSKVLGLPGIISGSMTFHVMSLWRPCVICFSSDCVRNIVKIVVFSSQGVPRGTPKASFGHSLADVSQKVDLLMILGIIWGAFGTPCGHHFGAFGRSWPPCDGFYVSFWGVLLGDPVLAPFRVAFGCTLGGANIAEVQ